MTATGRDNWVTRRAAAERALRNAAPNLWKQFRSSVHDACDSFNTEYAGGQTWADCDIENGHRISVGVSLPDKTPTSIVIVFKSQQRTIEVSGDGGKSVFSITVQKEGDVVISDIANNIQYGDVEQLSQAVLEPIL